MRRQDHQNTKLALRETHRAAAETDSQSKQSKCQLQWKIIISVESKASVGTVQFYKKIQIFPSFLSYKKSKLKQEKINTINSSSLITYLGVYLAFQSNSSCISLNKFPVTIFFSHIHIFIRQDAVPHPVIFRTNLAKPSP